MHWKLERDQFYRQLDLETAIEGGFFEDSSLENRSLDDLAPSTPIAHINVRASIKRPVALLMTGALNPTHNGHIAMMKAAKQYIEDECWTEGMQVVGGYLSPGHDEYIQMKYQHKAVPASTRVELALEAIKKDEDYLGWLSVDAWEAIWCKEAVNFTDVVTRLQNYLRAYVHPKIEVMYVCGGDNARFALAFQKKGLCCVVNRPGSEVAFASYRERLKDCKNIYWADNCHSVASSRKLLQYSYSFPEKPKKLKLRMENYYPEAEKNLLNIFKDYFEEVIPVYVKDQKLKYWELKKACLEKGQVPLSLDALIRTDFNLSISRRYDLGGYVKLGYVSRPMGTYKEASFEEQVLQLDPKFKYHLFDDDTVTGGTLNAAMYELLARGREVVGTTTLESHSPDYEIADARDFLDPYLGGLVIRQHYGTNVRKLYLMPYVDPCIRASIPDKYRDEFCERVSNI